VNPSWKRRFRIGDTYVGLDEPVFIIAEAGVAHFGKLEKAFRLVDLAVDANADAVKFQTFRAEDMISRSSYEWQERMRSKELRASEFRKIRDYCREKDIIFLSTAHDERSLDILSDLDVVAYKIGSGEVNNWEFISKVAAHEKPVILSTGMYDMKDIGEALASIAATGNTQLAVLHCVTSYPAAPQDVNLHSIGAISEEFGVITGYSDHTKGNHFPQAAVALGAKIIEKHISLDFDIPDAQDWKVSCGPHDFPLLVSQIREIEEGLGNGTKEPSDSEVSNMAWATKSLTAAKDIFPGEIISAEMIKVKRPGTGIVPSEKGKVIGRIAKTLIKADTLILWERLQ